MYKKKGFTLVELLAIIVILAIIAVIAIPSVKTIINNSKTRTYLNNEERLVDAAKLYLTRNTDKIPKDIGNTTEIKLSDLQASKYIGEIKSVFNKNNNCNGYVIVSKVADQKYDYTPHLNCINDIGNSLENGLVVHYTFDDFQEPTENYISKVEWQNWFASLDVGDSIDRTVNEGIIRVTRLDKYKYKATVIEDTTYPVLSLTSSFSWPANVPCIISANITDYYESPGTKGRLGLGRSSNGGADLHGYDGLGPKDYSYLADVDRTGGISIRAGNVLIKSGTYIEWEFIQVEFNKPYSTPFVDEIREGIVKDYSGNGNHSELEIYTTPRWIKESKDGSGAYQFDGINSYIKIGNTNSLTLSDGGTIAAWVNMSSWGGTSWSNTIVGKGSSSWSNHHYILFKYRGTQKMHLSVSDGIRYLGAGGPQTPNLELNTWYYIVATWDDQNKCIYSNGVLSECVLSDIMPTSAIAPVSIGKTGTATYYFNGLIDDVRIYSRVLSEEEINLLYDAKKFKQIKE